MNAMPTLPAPIQPTTRLGSRRPNTALTRNPASGESRTNGAIVSMPALLLHQVELVDIHLAAAPVHLHDDGDPDHDLGRRHRDHEESKHHSVERIEKAALGGEGQI